MDDSQRSDNQTETGGRWPRRRHPRLQDPNVVGCVAFRASARLVDISEHGLALESSSALPPLREYRMTVRDGGRELNLRGTAVWNRLTTTETTLDGEVCPVFRAGFRFSEDSRSQSATVKDFISISGAKPTGSRSSAQRYRPVRESRVIVSGEAGFLVKTISKCGALLETESMLQSGENVEISMHLPSGEIEAQGRMVDSHRGFDESGEPCIRVAVEFQDLSAEAQNEIGRLVAAGSAA